MIIRTACVGCQSDNAAALPRSVQTAAIVDEAISAHLGQQIHNSQGFGIVAGGVDHCAVCNLGITSHAVGVAGVACFATGCFLGVTDLGLTFVVCGI